MNDLTLREYVDEKLTEAGQFTAVGGRLDGHYAARMYEYLQGNCESVGAKDEEDAELGLLENEPLWRYEDLQWAQEQYRSDYPERETQAA